MPCSFCRSHEHNIRYCNSPQVNAIVSRIAQDANTCSRNFDYNGFARTVHRLNHSELKIAALFWHTSIPSAEYEMLLLEGDVIPVIQCNFSRDKFLYIVLWLYLDYAYSNNEPAILSLPDIGMNRIGLFLERLEFLRRIVIDGMNVMRSLTIYSSVIRENAVHRSRFQSPQPFPRRIDFDSAAFGYAQRHFNNKFEFNIEELGDSSDFAKTPDTDCPICYETLTESCVKLGCNHVTCSGCFILYLKTRNTPNICCSLCRADILTVKTYDKELIPDLKHYTNVDDKPIEDVPRVPHVPERFDEGDNVVINFV